MSSFKEWLGEDGIAFFTELYAEHGELSVVLKVPMEPPYPAPFIPHPVHFREGMQVRNWMRENTDVPEEELDDRWEAYVIEALGLRVTS